MLSGQFSAAVRIVKAVAAGCGDEFGARLALGVLHKHNANVFLKRHFLGKVDARLVSTVEKNILTISS